MRKDPKAAARYCEFQIKRRVPIGLRNLILCYLDAIAYSDGTCVGPGWPCDRATIARLEREKGELRAALAGTIDERDTASARVTELESMVAESVKAEMLEAVSTHKAGLPVNLWSEPGPITPELAAELEAAAEQLEALELPAEMLDAWREKARKRIAAFARANERIAALEAGIRTLGQCAECGGSGKDGPDGDGWVCDCDDCDGTGLANGARALLERKA